MSNDQKYWVAFLGGLACLMLMWLLAFWFMTHLPDGQPSAQCNGQTVCSGAPAVHCHCEERSDAVVKETK